MEERMMRMHRRAVSAVTVWMMMTLVLTGCTSEASNIGVAKDKKGNVVDTGFTVSTVGSYDSADTAVVLSTDLTNKAVSLVNMDTGKQYTLYYDGTTYVKDKYDGPMTISQIKAGDVVDVTFLKGKKKLASIKRSPEAWIFDDLDNYDLAGANRTASIGSLTYALPDEAVVLSEGRRVEKEEVMAQDVVTISGIDHKIYSVKVDKGHGYLRLKNDQPLLGGWIEVGNSVIRQITEDMLLVVPEGSYQVVLSNNGVGCVKEITVERNKEVVLDVGDVEIAEDKTGTILFNVTPKTAKVSVDGKPVDISRAVEMRYGIHQVQVEASGYDTLTKYIQVGSEYATISFTLEESRKTDDDKNSVSGNTTERIPWQDTLASVNKDSVSDNALSSLSENALGTSNT
ncbi:MAG: PEGA domain-containing protein, partial [Lachnospiraceae bacterium]|nr:PEGA domain-containing protein [Lachnospiraceae bacterium]